MNHAIEPKKEKEKLATLVRELPQDVGRRWGQR